MYLTVNQARALYHFGTQPVSLMQVRQEEYEA